MRDASICALGQAAPNPVDCVVKYFAGELAPLPPTGFRGEFYKHGTRPGLDIAAISISLGARRDGSLLRDVRLAFGAVAPTPVRAPRTEAALEGRPVDAVVLEAAARIALEEVRPISDVRASDWYRRELVHNMLKGVLTHVGQL